MELYQLVGGVFFLFISSLILFFYLKESKKISVSWSSLLIFYLLVVLGGECVILYSMPDEKPGPTVRAVGMGSDVCDWDCMWEQAPSDCVGQCDWCRDNNWMCSGCYYCDQSRYEGIRNGSEYDD